MSPDLKEALEKRNKLKDKLDQGLLEGSQSVEKRFEEFKRANRDLIKAYKEDSKRNYQEVLEGLKHAA